MQLHGDSPKRKFTGRTCSLHPSLREVHAAHIAYHRAEEALHAGRLISPGEALALAGPEARSKETLFSIARDVAWETDCDQDEIMCRLGEHFPDLS